MRPKRSNSLRLEVDDMGMLLRRHRKLEHDAETNVADKTALSSAIADAETLVESDWTPESFSVLKAAVEALQNVNADENVMQEDVDAAVSAFNNAVGALEVIKSGQSDNNKSNEPPEKKSGFFSRK
jgi:hypothetical protein